jgi:hypothetical protein
MNRDKAKQIARKLGCQIYPIDRTGELRFDHPVAARPCRVDGRRKDAPRHLVVWLRNVQAALN